MLDLSDLTPDHQDDIRNDVRIALTGGLVAVGVMAAVIITVGSVGGSEARGLLESSTPTVRTFCSAVMVTMASTLALMLTLLGLTTNSDHKIKRGHYARIRQIAAVAVVAFVGATLLLVALVIPLTESAGISTGWYVGIYYGSTLLAAVLGGLLVAAMILLNAAVRDLVKTFGPGEESPLYAEEEEEGAGEEPDA